jgi:translation elongation factor EF-1beta
MDSELNENEFYVCLLSNGSTSIYNTNVQSSFTNLLRKPCRLNENWYVGLSEIAFNKINKSSQRYMIKRSLNAESMDSDSDYVDDIESNGSAKRLKRDSYKLTLDLDENSFITINEKDLKKYAYKTNRINFSNLLRLLSGKILNNTNKQEMKSDVMQNLKSTNWKNVAYQPIGIGKHEFYIHIYQGSKIAYVASLKYKHYSGLSEIIYELIKQIPVEKRKFSSLRNTFNNYFYSEFEIDLKKDSEISSKKSIKIPMSEVAAIIEITPDKKQYDINELVKSFSNNLISEDKTNKLFEGDKDKEEFLNKIKDFVMDVVGATDFTQPYINKSKNEGDTILNVPYKIEKDIIETLPAVLEKKNYKQFDEFINGIISQIEPLKRDKSLLLNSINTAFTEARKGRSNINVNQSFDDQYEIIGKQLATSQDGGMIYVYSDILKPRRVDNMEIRILRIIPNASNNRHLRFNPIEYCPLENNYIESISILVTDSAGERVNFETSTIPTYVMLHFKKLYK